jgi:hypothetical protein
MLSLTIDIALTAAWLFVHVIIVIAAVYVGLGLHSLSEGLVDRLNRNNKHRGWP